jgi:hypothetical protein
MPGVGDHGFHRDGFAEIGADAPPGSPQVKDEIRAWLARPGRHLAIIQHGKFAAGLVLRAIDQTENRLRGGVVDGGRGDRVELEALFGIAPGLHHIGGREEGRGERQRSGGDQKGCNGGQAHAIYVRLGCWFSMSSMFSRLTSISGT